MNSLFQINTEIKGSVKLREKTLVIGHQFANVFSCQHFPLYSIQQKNYYTKAAKILFKRNVGAKVCIGC